MNDKYNEIKEKILEAREKYNNSIGEPRKKIPNDEFMMAEEVIDFYGQKGDLTFDILTQLHKEKLFSTHTICFAIIDRSEKDKIYNIDLSSVQLLEKAKEGNEFAQEFLVCMARYNYMENSLGVQKIEEYAGLGWKYAIITLLHIYKYGMPGISRNPIKLKEACIKFNIPFDEKSQKYDLTTLIKE